MIEYENKNKKFFLNLNLKEISTESNGRILNFSVCQDKLSILLSTERHSCRQFSFEEILLFPDVLVKKQSQDKLKTLVNNFIQRVTNKSNINKELLISMIFEMNPTKGEEDDLAISLGNNVISVQLSKNKSYEVNHEENSKCIFIQWENELIICAFENKVIKIIRNYSHILKTFVADSIITALKIIHYQDFNLLVVGFNNKVKIFHFNSVLDNEFQFYTISKLEGNIDIIEYKNNHILFCSKENKIIYCYYFMNNNWKPKFSFEINNYNFQGLESEQEIINVKLISSSGIIVTFKNKIYLFYFEDDKFELYYRLNEDNISFSSLIYSRNQYYMIYCLQEKIKIIEIIDIKNSSYSKDVVEIHKKIIDTCINTLLNRKNEFTIKKTDEYILFIEIDYIVLKLEFNIDDLSINFSILKCLDEHLKLKIEEEIAKIKSNEEEKNNDYNEYVTEKILMMNHIIKNSDISDSTSEGESEIVKLKQDQFLKNYKTFKNWRIITEKKIPTKNLFNDNDDYEFDLNNKIMGESIKNLLPKWNFNYEDLLIDKAFTFANSNYFSSNNPLNKIEEEDKAHKEQLQIPLDRIMDKEKFSILADILAQIKYYLQEIYNQNSTNLIKLYRENILDILVSLETGLNYEFLFICIIPLSELIWKEMNKRVNMIRNKSLMKELIDYRYQRNSLNNEKKDINRNISGSWSSDLDNPNDNDSDKDMDEDYVLEFESEEPQINDQNKDGGENKKNSILTLDFIDRNNQKKFTYNKSTNYKNNDEFIKSKKNFLSKKFNKIKDISICSNKYEKNLIESLTSSFCNSIIDYVIFFVEKLKLLNVDSPDKKLINFFDLTNKYYENENINNEISQIIKRT